MKSFLEFLLEYRHNLADGSSAPSIQAHNGKNPNSIDKKKLHTVGPYKPKSEHVHNPGKILMGDDLLATLAEYNLDFRDGEVSKIKNSPHGIHMYYNHARQPVGKIVKLK